MLRPSLTTAASMMLCASAMAQADLSSRPQPITAPLKHAGVYHVATGTWTRGASQSVLGPDIIYNNSCNSGYFAGTKSGELIQHRSRLPTTLANGAPETDSVFYPGNVPAHQYDQRPGCATTYNIQHFEVVYCSSIVNTGVNTIDWFFSFADAYTLCGTGDMVPDPACDYLVTGLPVGTTTGAQNCWIIDIDLALVTPACNLSADQDGTYVGPPETETFGYSNGPASAGITSLNGTGMVIAGNFTWTGGTLTGVLTPCTGVDGTIWDSPVNLAEEGTGMNSQDFFRITGPAPSAAAGCYFFGGNPHGDFYLKLFSKTCPPASPLIANCLPGQGGIIPCPCGNPPAGGGLGCNNFGAGPAASATLGATGVASLANDTVTLVATGENNTSTTVFWTGKNPKSATGVVHAAGVRCVTQALKRMYTHSASGGTVSAPVGADLSVSARTAQVYAGVPIAPGETRKYFNIYRDPAAAGPCGSTASTVNLTNSGGITWAP